ncbi:malate permease [Williamsoniiplasma luminosum]|uniref:Malate permease n=1 Tax=Williamsoniiplasma luminosum TaxID=214888 RepID=A0A2K8NSH1_9MOLU|nr:malate permease [Williamsoniiplasma luminosum]
MSINELINNTFGNFNFWSILIAVIVVIGIGFFLQKKQIIIKDWEKVLVKIVLYVALPALALKSFLVDINTSTLTEAFIVMLIGGIFFTLVTFGSQFFFYKTRPSLKVSLGMVVAFPSAAYFGFPILLASFSEQKAEILTMSSMFLVAFWILLSTGAIYYFQKPLLNKEHLTSDLNRETYKYQLNWKNLKPVVLNPVLIATFIGFLLWISQLIPGINLIPNSKSDLVSISRIDVYIPGVNKILEILSLMASPLAWLAIGTVVAKGQLVKALKNKIVWYTVFLRNILMPLIALLIILFFAWIGDLSHGFRLSTLVLMLMIAIVASPTATTIVSYAIAFHREQALVSETTSLTILTSFITLPLWIFVAGLIGISTGLFT